MFFSFRKATLAFPILTVISASVPPPLSIMLARNVSMSTFSDFLPSKVIEFLLVVFTLIIFVSLIFSPLFLSLTTCRSFPPAVVDYMTAVPSHLKNPGPRVVYMESTVFRCDFYL